MISFDEYLKGFDYDERKEMKISLPKLLEGYKNGEIELIDIRFNEEYEAWHVGIGKHIPLNELPDRLNEIDKNKIVVTMCPHYDRASIARHYLKLKGFRAKYLVEGMLGLVDYLRGDKARDYIKEVKHGS